MGKRDPRVEAYIAKSPEFAKPILNRIRQEVHAACPDVEEDMKWGSPHFMYKGMMCAMASFKQHAAFGFWKGSLVVGACGHRHEQRGLVRTADEGVGPPAAEGARRIRQERRWR